MLWNETVTPQGKKNVENSRTTVKVYLNIILQFGFMNIPGVLCRESMVMDKHLHDIRDFKV